jgi:hypothetical protein
MAAQVELTSDPPFNPANSHIPPPRSGVVTIQANVHGLGAMFQWAKQHNLTVANPVASFPFALPDSFLRRRWC